MEPATLEAPSSPTASTAENTATPDSHSPHKKPMKAFIGKARRDALANLIGCFEGPSDLSERHSEYFAAKTKLTAPITGEALIKLWEGYIGSFEGPGNLSERHSEYFTEALSEKFERRKTQMQ